MHVCTEQSVAYHKHGQAVKVVANFRAKRAVFVVGKHVVNLWRNKVCMECNVRQKTRTQ